METSILLAVQDVQLQLYTFLDISQNVLREKITLVGCHDHIETLTRNIINYYTITRSKILCKMYNNINNKRLEEKKSGNRQNLWQEHHATKNDKRINTYHPISRLLF